MSANTKSEARAKRSTVRGGGRSHSIKVAAHSGTHHPKHRRNHGTKHGATHTGHGARAMSKKHTSATQRQHGHAEHATPKATSGHGGGHGKT